MMRDFYLAIYVNDVDNDVVETSVVKNMRDAERVPCTDKRKIADKQQMLYPVLDNYPV